MIDKIGKENSGGNEAPLEQFARELPPGLHERVMASVRADVARMGIYRRLRLTALFAAAMLCIFIVSSTMWVLPTLVRKETTDGESCEQTSVFSEAENEEGICGSSGEKQESYASEAVSDPQDTAQAGNETLKDQADGNETHSVDQSSQCYATADSQKVGAAARVTAAISGVFAAAAVILVAVQRKKMKSDKEIKKG